jgi:serine/threonine-protein kinase
MSEESVMKQALPSEVPARVRRGQLRAITLGLGASVLAMACSFGEIDNDPIDENEGNVDPSTDTNVQPGEEPEDNQGPSTGNPTNPRNPSNPQTVDPDAPPYNPDEDPFSTEMGQQVADILKTNCGNCHIGQGASGDFGYLLDMEELLASGKIIPGSKEDSRIYARMVEGTMPPAAVRVIQTPTYGQIDLVGQFIDELKDVFEDEGTNCPPLPFMDADEQIRLMQADMAGLDDNDKPFTRYLTITYASNAGLCGRPLQRQRFALFKGINSVSTNPVVTQPVAINQDETIYRIDIRKYNWDRQIDLQDNDITDPANVDFQDGWEAIIANPETAAYAVEYTGPQADDLKADAQTAVPFLPVNVFIQATEFGDLYYALIGAKANLFDFEREVLLLDTAAEIEDDNLMRAGFENSGVSKQERVLNRFDSNLGPGTSYWISFDFDGGNGNGEVNGVSNGFEQNVANESIFSNPLDFAFAGGEAIFSLPNGLQAYYVAAADGTRLAEAPIGVVIDPAQNNGLVTNGASCHSCHNAGMITFTDTVRQYVEENKRDFDNDTYESVMAQYVDARTFQDAMDRDSLMHVSALERAGVPAETPDAVSRTYLDFQLGNIDINLAAGELGVPADELVDNIDNLDPRLGNLEIEGGFVDRNIQDATFLDSICILQAIQDNQPLNCQ